MKHFIRLSLVLLSLTTISSISLALNDLSGDYPSATSKTSCVDLSTSFGIGTQDVSTGGSVSSLQNYLLKAGYFTGEPTGYFGNITSASVRKFQTAQNFAATGYVGPLTRAAIKKATCSGATVNTNTSADALANARIAATNASIIARVVSFQPAAEITYDAQNKSYASLCQNGLINTNATPEAGIASLAQGIITAQGVTDQSSAGITCIASKDKYALQVMFKKFSPAQNRRSYCVDSTGKTGSDTEYVIDVNSMSCRSIVALNPTATPISSVIKSSLTVLAPNGGETFKQGDKVTIRWQHDSKFAGKTIIYSVGVGPVGGVHNSVSYSTMYVSPTSPSTSQILWTVPTTFQGEYEVQVEEVDSSRDVSTLVTDRSNATFRVSPPVLSGLPPKSNSPVTVLSPNGSEIFQAGQTIHITWSTKNLPSSGTMRVVLYKKNENQFLLDNLVNTGSVDMILPKTAFGSDYKIGVSFLSPNVNYGDESDQFFTINPTQEYISFPATNQNTVFSVQSPTSGSQYSVGNTINVQWTPFSGDFDFYNLALYSTYSNNVGVSIGNLYSSKDQNYASIALTSDIVQGIVSNSNGYTRAQIKDNYYVTVKAVKMGGGRESTVAEARSSTFSIQ